MKTRSPFLTEFIILPEIILVMVYIVVARLYSIWVGMNCDLRGLGPHRLITFEVYLGITAVDLAFGVAFILAALRVRRSPLGLRKGHIASLILATCAVLVIQYVAHQAYGPIKFV